MGLSYPSLSFVCLLSASIPPSCFLCLLLISGNVCWWNLTTCHLCVRPVISLFHAPSCSLFLPSFHWDIWLQPSVAPFPEIFFLNLIQILFAAFIIPAGVFLVCFFALGKIWWQLEICESFSSTKKFYASYWNPFCKENVWCFIFPYSCFDTGHTLHDSHGKYIRKELSRKQGLRMTVYTHHKYSDAVLTGELSGAGKGNKITYPPPIYLGWMRKMRIFCMSTEGAAGKLLKAVVPVSG